tara:strand:- start:337 stop:717 length:381 start_codon:yes stop_codon:yes gene_type:complete
MVKSFDAKFEVDGPILESGVSQIMKEIVNRGLLDLATIEGSNHVKDQLYPGHGRLTGNLRNHVGANLIADNVAVVDAGETRYGADIQYAEKIEKLYGMFAKSAARIKSTPGLYQQYIGDAIVEAFQ